MNSKPFKGTNVFMSRNLVPPELFDSLHDALKLNGADVFLCCDPSRNFPDDFHVISSSDHEKFEGLRAKGCNLVGPQCVLACAKERRALPKEGYTCCLAMDGVKVLISGFEMEERAKFGKLVAAMGGSLLTRPTSDISFVIVKNVIAAKYKWAIHVKKPVVTINWLHQCWNEHRIVPQESYRVPTFSGLIICVTRIPGDERKEMEKLIVQNGGRYSAELTRACTHLICEVAEGDKYKVAKKWGHIRIVTRKWFDQSIAKRTCLGEESYSVQGGSVSSNTGMKGSFAAKIKLEKNIEYSQSTQPSVVPDSNLQAVPSSGNVDFELETTLSQSFSVIGDEREAPQVEPQADLRFDDCVANDSDDDDDLYMSDSKICLVGFNASDMRRLVNMIRKGGGSRYTSYSDRLTHIVVGSLSDVERKELRGLAAVGVIHIVQPNWLEECDRAKKEIPVVQRHMAHDVLLPKDLGFSIKGSKNNLKQERVATMPFSMPVDPSSEVLKSGHAMLFEEGRGQATDVNIKGGFALGGNLSSTQHSLPIVTDKVESQKKVQHTGNLKTVPGKKSSGIFMGKLFCFSKSFPQDRRDEVVEWISEGGGMVVDDHLKKNVDFTVECHGVPPQSSSSLQTTHVSTHWVRSCLEGGILLDVAGHVLYSPLPCRTPLPGFERYRLCVSQYEEKERLLLRNLCFVLGAKFGEKLNKRVTHLICKFSSGPKYEACPKWGIEPVTCDWIYECIRKDGIVALDSFRPKEPSDRDLKAGLCTLSQFPTQAVQMLSGDSSSQLFTQSLDVSKPVTRSANMTASSSRKQAEITTQPSKKACLFRTGCSDNDQDLLSRSDKLMPPSVGSMGVNMQQYAKEKPVTRSANMMASSSRKEAEITVQPSKKASLFVTVCSEDDQDLLSRSDILMPPSVSSKGLNMQQYVKEKPVTRSANMMASSSNKEAEITVQPSKKACLFGTVGSEDDQDLLSRSDKLMPPSVSSMGQDMQQYVKENSQTVPDVAAAIEDLLEQTTKIHDMSTPGGTENQPTLDTDPADSHTGFGLSTHWSSRVKKQDEPRKPSKEGNPGIHDGFSETQTESQLVGYEEDLSGRQMIIERVRTRSCTLE